jgi:hypothetical protein
MNGAIDRMIIVGHFCKMRVSLTQISDLFRVIRKLFGQFVWGMGHVFSLGFSSLGTKRRGEKVIGTASCGCQGMHPAQS